VGGGKAGHRVGAGKGKVGTYAQDQRNEGLFCRKDVLRVKKSTGGNKNKNGRE